VLGQGRHDLVCGDVREAGDRYVADSPGGEVPAADLDGLDHVARDDQRARRRAAALDTEADHAALRPPDHGPGGVDREPIE
jgi:hypothetical protein